MLTLLKVVFVGDITTKKQWHNSKISPVQETWTLILPDTSLWENAIYCLLFWHYYNLRGGCLLCGRAEKQGFSLHQYLASS